MPNYRYRALTQAGEIVNGTISAPTAAEVARRIEYLKLLPIETTEDKRASGAAGGRSLFGGPSAAEVTTFTRDLALLLKAGARLDDALELLSGDADVGRIAADELRADLVVEHMDERAIAAGAAGGVLAFAPADQAVIGLDAHNGGVERRHLTEVAAMLLRNFDRDTNPPGPDAFDAHVFLSAPPPAGRRDGSQPELYLISGSSVSAVMRIWSV